MSVLALFGGAVIIALVLLVALFIAAVYHGAGSDTGDGYADNDTIDQSFQTHGVHYR
ncbi:hypothetical protein CLV63_106171 [Murinocardiopsis flavida]|uniref:Uncharacterized protein n=1 Tax=Murinocardiopsis flavida TaxID=645275 RepID=A0A2P8DLL6_9ACTN|nr:hypothetical protein [Murinocardiopsis flavida]PSK98123.1 hypothetical protein CLV63_106171 [Murinocardiopsis flavida]